jgi:hypothetical protein
MTIEATRYPLTWPHDCPRTPDDQRKNLGSGASYDSAGRRKTIGFNDVIERLLRELGLLKASHFVISTNQPVRNDGMPFAQERRIDDPGAAVYFLRAGRQLCVPCDRYLTIADNLRAIALSIEAMRSLERHGGMAMMDRAFSGFAQLAAANVPAKPRRPWREVFGLAESLPVTPEIVEAMFKALSRSRHPDMAGGNDDDFRELVTAREDADKELAG